MFIFFDEALGLVGYRGKFAFREIIIQTMTMAWR